MAVRVIWMLVLMATSIACGAPSTTPTGSSKPQPPSPLWVRCAPGPQLICAAEFGSEGNVTGRAIWSAAESYQSANDLPIPSKPGYAATVQTHGGITMRDLTYPVNDTLHFYPAPVQ